VASWTGHRLLFDESLRALKSLDMSGKIVFLPGDHIPSNLASKWTQNDGRELGAAGQGATGCSSSILSCVSESRLAKDAKR